MLTTRRELFGAAEVDHVAVEAPLELRVEGEALAVLMRTPGHDIELAMGFLRGEGVIDDAEDLSAIAEVAENVIDCRLASGVQATELARRTPVSSACGICGRATLDRVHLVANQPVRAVEVPDPAQLAEQLTSLQQGFMQTGGLHGAGLARDGTLVIVREDVGRHNAADKVLGWDLQHGGIGGALVVSSRAGFEIVQKARMAGLGAVIAMGAPTDLAIDLARESGMALYGFVQRARYNRYT